MLILTPPPMINNVTQTLATFFVFKFPDDSNVQQKFENSETLRMAVPECRNESRMVSSRSLPPRSMFSARNEACSL